MICTRNALTGLDEFRVVELRDLGPPLRRSENTLLQKKTNLRMQSEPIEGYNQEQTNIDHRYWPGIHPISVGHEETSNA